MRNLPKGLCFAAVSGFVLLTFALVVLFTLPNSCTLEVSVVDAYTMQPLKDAKVLLPSQRETAITDTQGKALFTGLRASPNPQHRRLLPTAAGETTLLVYKEGYLPYALFYLHIDESRLSSPTAYMFPVGEEGVEVISMIESPDVEWVKQLLEKFKPD